MENKDLHSQEQTLNQLRQGDEKAFRSLHHRFRVRLIYFVMKMGIEQSEAEDIVADAFVKLWQQRQSLQSMPHISNFLYAVCRNNGLNLLDFKQRQAGYLDRYSEMQVALQETFSQERVAAEMMSFIDEAMQVLPPKCKEVFELFLDDFASIEIAEKLSISMATVRSQKKKAIDLLKKWFKDHPDELACLLLLANQLFI